METTKLPDLMTEVSTAIKKTRKEKSLSLEKVAKAAGIRKQTLIEIEKGNNCELFTLQKVCDQLGLRVVVFR